jgi:hypothetical protein
MHISSCLFFKNFDFNFFFHSMYRCLCIRQACQLRHCTADYA